MSNTNKNKTKSQCETDTDSCATTDSCSTTDATTVTPRSVNYARMCIILLALNFCVTGYVLVNSLKLQEQTLSAPATPDTNAETTTLSQDDATREGEVQGATKPVNWSALIQEANEDVVEELRAIRALQEEYRQERREVKK